MALFIFKFRAEKDALYWNVFKTVFFHYRPFFDQNTDVKSYLYTD